MLVLKRLYVGFAFPRQMNGQ